MDAEEEPSLPIIDLRQIKSKEADLAKNVVKALENEGFLYIDGVDVDFNKLYKACVWFFNLPPETLYSITRQPHNPNAKTYYRGFIPIAQGEASRKQAYQIGPQNINRKDHRINPENWMYEETPFPPEDETCPFRDIMTEYYQKVVEAAMQILELIAIGLGIRKNAFEEVFGDLALNTLRIIHYPPWKESENKPPGSAYTSDGKLMTTPEHSDSPLLTLLHTFNFDGLQILGSNGKWKSVPKRIDGFVMNIGDTLMRMVDGRFKATRHRVLDVGMHRYSVALFMEPHFDADIGVNWISQWTGQGNHTYERYGPWMIHTVKHVKKYAESRTLPDFDY